MAHPPDLFAFACRSLYVVTVTRMIGHYELLKELGAGAAATVYLARDQRSGGNVALKLLHVNLTRDEAQVRRFLQEAEWVSMLHHPNILSLHEVGEAEGTHFMVTEFVEGATLRQHIANTMTLPQILDVAIGTANALVVAHASWIVHRDIKPENIMLRRDGVVKVLDFGLAKLTQPLKNTKPLTRPGTVVGTLQYLAPEQIYGIGVDTRTDLYSLGVIMFEMITGFPPFDGASNRELVRSILQAEVPSMESSNVPVPQELDEIVRTALAREMEERFQTAGEMRIELLKLREKITPTSDS